MSERIQDLETSTLRIVLDRARIDVRELQWFMGAIDTVAICASVVVLSRGVSGRDWGMANGWSDEQMPGGIVFMPTVLSVRNESPVTVVLQALDVPALIGLMAFLLKNPAALPSLLARYKVGREVAKARAEAVYFWRQQIQEMQANGVDVNELPDPPDWIIGKM